jgi:hypothetical protein
LKKFLLKTERRRKVRKKEEKLRRIESINFKRNGEPREDKKRTLAENKTKRRNKFLLHRIFIIIFKIK